MPKIRLHKKVSEIVKTNRLEYTNPEIQRNIENYGVYVDDELLFKRLEWVYDYQKIEITNWPQRPKGNFSEVKIIQPNADFLLIYKPIGVVVEKGAGHIEDNLLYFLEKKFNQKFYLVHRLDKDTQGLLLIAKSEEIQECFQNQFRTRKVKKGYLAVVDNLVENLWITKHYQTRDGQNVLKQKLFWDIEAKEFDSKYRQAETIIRPKVVCSELNQSIIEVEIKTGRMHQIRVVCEALGFPLSNDKVYNQKLNLNKEDLKNNNIQKKLSIKLPQETSALEFKELQTKIFGKTEYCLLSNFLKIKLPTGEILEAEIFGR